MSTKKTVTIKTIAKEFNVTPATVSKALRNSSDISESTKRKIKELAIKMNYKPNLMARNLVNKKSNIIGVIVPDIVTSFFGWTVQGINSKARENRYRTMLLVNDENYTAERKDIEFLTNLRVDGIIIDSVPGNHNNDLLEELLKRDFPIVYVDRKCENNLADSVTTNDIKAGYTITKHFIESGRKNIAFIGSVNDMVVAHDRFKGYKKALKEYGIKFNDKLVLGCDYVINEEKLIRDIRDFVASDRKFDAFLCAGGVQAYFVGLVLFENGLSIPDDVMLGEFGDNNIVHRLGVPFVTVEQSPSEIGKKAVEMLVERISNPTETKRKVKNIFIKARLIQNNPSTHKQVVLEEI